VLEGNPVPCITYTLPVSGSRLNAAVLCSDWLDSRLPEYWHWEFPTNVINMINMCRIAGFLDFVYCPEF
jgi:hypothetical protein